MNTSLGFEGTLHARKLDHSVPLVWKIKNILRWNFLVGWVAHHLAKVFSSVTGVVTMTPELRIDLIKHTGERIEYGAVCHNVITDDGVAFLVDDWQAGTTSMQNIKWHQAGTSSTAEAAGDTDVGVALDTCEEGTNTQPSANILRSVATITFTSTGSVVEHGLFSSSDRAVLWDRSVFSAINVENGDSIQFTYNCTVNSGG